jgi:tight adherence protein C
MAWVPANLDANYLVLIGVFGATVCLTWLILDMLSRPAPKAERRLERLRSPLGRGRAEEAAGTDKLARMLEKAAPKLARPLQSSDEKEVSQLRQRLSYAGFRSDGAATAFLGLKFVGLICGLIAGGAGSWLLGYGAMNSLYQAIVAAGILFYLPEVVIMVLGYRRKKAIFLGLPDALDLLVVCVEAGLGLDQAMRKVGEEMRRTHPVIAEEFALCNFHLQLGRPRAEVLQDLGNRTGVDDLRSLASILIQADKFGSSIAQALRVQSDSMRVRRRQIAEEKAAKTAVKLIFPLVLFIFPGIFVVLVGPAAITMMREMFPAMSGG